MLQAILQEIRKLGNQKLYNDLREICAYNAERDIYYRNMAVAAFKKFLTFMEKNEDNPKKVMQKARSGWVIYGEKIDREFKDIAFYLLPIDSGYMAAMGKFEGKIIICLKCLPSRDDDPNNELENFSIYDIRRKEFIHEYTHYLDEFRANPEKLKSPVDNIIKYVNSPREFNAFFQEGADDLITYAKHVINDYFGDFERYELTFPKDINKFIKNSLKLHFSKIFNKLVYPEYEKKFMKRFSMLYQEIQDMLYPKDGKKPVKYELGIGDTTKIRNKSVLKTLQDIQNLFK